MKTHALFVILILALCVSCHKKAEEDEDAAPDVSAANVEVDVATVQQGEMRQVVPVSGTLSALPDRDVKISALVPARVDQLLVIEGDTVSQGQILARLDSTTLEDQAKQAKAVFDNAKQNEEREKKLFERGISAGKEVEDAHKDFVSAEAAYNTAAVQLSRTVIRSPIAGNVAKRFVSVGEQVDGTPANPIVEVANFDPVELVANLPTSFLAAVHEKQAAEIKTDAYPNVSFSGNVVSIFPAVDPSTGSATLRIRVPNPNHQLKGGMFATGTIIANAHPNALFIPASALVMNNEVAHVFVVGTNSKAQERTIEIGWRDGNKVEVLKGLSKGETVVTTGSYGLAEGMTVTPKKEQSNESR
jgi:membrane fusion protein, multidrug efflux system